MTHRLRSGLPPPTAPLFEHPAYVQASAAHEGADPWLIAGGSASLPLLRDRAGLHTVYGYAQPFGDCSASALDRLGVALRSLPVPLRTSLCPLGRGAALSARLRVAASARTTRPICVVDLGLKHPAVRFASSARNKVKRAAAAVGGGVEVTQLLPWFGDLYRRSMRARGVDATYLFDDAYLTTLTELDHVLVSVSDADGVLAAALFLFGDELGTYHLSARRQDPPVTPGAVNLAVVVGLREAQRRGVPCVLLGGGLGRGPKDPLFVFKRAMATRVVEQETLLFRPVRR